MVTAPELPPGQDYLTGDSTGPFIDTGLDVEDLTPIGRVYLSVATISDLAQHLGFTPPEASSRARARLAELEQLVAELTEANQRLITANEALFAAGYTPPEPSIDVPAGSVEDVMAWVLELDDPVERDTRARAAWESEQAEERPRKTLQKQLTELIYVTSQEEPHADAHPE